MNLHYCILNVYYFDITYQFPCDLKANGFFALSVKYIKTHRQPKRKGG